MSEELENTAMQLEQWLRERNWNQLSDAERAEVEKFGSSKAEYERIYSMVHQLKTSSGVHDEELVPSANTRGNLLQAFGEEQKKRRAIWWSAWWFRLSGALRFDIPAVRIGFAMLLLIGGVFTVVKLMNNDKAAPIAKKENILPTTQAPKEIAPSDNNITVAPENEEKPAQPLPQNVVPQDDNMQITPAPTNNGLQVVDGNTQLIVDTNSNRLAANPLDTNNLVVIPLTAFTNVTSGVCCGANVTINATANGGTNYNWTATSNGSLTGNDAFTNGVSIVTVNGLPPRARALSNDAQVLDVFFTMK